MRMVLQGLTPGMEPADETDLRAEMARIGGDCAQRFGRRLEQDSDTAALFWNAISAADAGSVKTTWKYGTGKRSASCSLSHSRAAAPWHFGQCRLPQEL